VRVLHVFKTYLPDSFTGIERVIWELAEGSAARGISVEVLSLSDDPRRNSVQVGSHFAHKARRDIQIASTGLSVSFFARFAHLAASADIVHYHFPWPVMDLAHLFCRVKTGTVVTYHSDVVRQRRLRPFYSPLMHRFLGEVDRIVATSPNYLETSQVLRRYRAKTSVIPIGIDPAGIIAPPEEALAKWRERLPQPFFLFVGALRYYKGLAFLIEAARQTGLPVVVAGDGEMRDELAAAGLPNLVALGAVSDADKAALLKLSYAFVFPSHLRSEAFGVALLEAAVAGKAMISCEVGTGTSYVNRDNETGLVIPPGDAGALAAAMNRLWADPAQTARYGAAASARAKALFTAEQMSEDYVSLYHEILADKPRRP